MSIHSEDKRLVFSSDPAENEKIKKPNPSPQELPHMKFVAIFSLEKNHRGGKIVTVIHGFPKNEIFLKNLCKEIKSKCGVGGTHDSKEGVLEIQGDQREKVKKILESKGIKFKGM
jgi:translation initiation factor 1